MTNKVFYGLAASVAILGFASCSSSDDGGDSPLSPNQPTVGVLMDDVTSDYQSTIVNNLVGGGTRATATGYTLPDGFPSTMINMPSVPDDAQPLNLVNANGQKRADLDNSGDRVIKSGESVNLKNYEGSFNMSGANIYVSGRLTINEAYGAANIYVLKGGTLVINGNSDGLLYNTGCNIYNWGKVQFNQDMIYVASNEQLYNAGTIVNHSNKDLKIQGTFYTTGNVAEYKSLTFESSAKVNILGDLRASTPGTKGSDDDLYDLTLDGYVHVGGKVIAKNLTMVNSGALICDCSIYCSEKLTTNSLNNIYADFVHAKNIDQASGAKIYVGDGGYVNVEDTYKCYNNGNDAAISFTGGAGKYAVVHAKKFESNSSESGDQMTDVYFLKAPNGGTLYVNSNRWSFNDKSEMPIDSVNFYSTVQPIKQVKAGTEGAKEIVAADSCHGAGFYSTDLVPNPIKQLEVVSDQHTHDISATCVQKNGNNVYLSFHQRGIERSGCIEYLTTTGDKTTLKQFVRDHNKSIDFNHIMLNGSRIYAVGNNRNGGFLGYMNLNGDGSINVADSSIAEKTYNPLRIVKLHQAREAANVYGTNGGDGNAVVYQNGQLKVASTYGLEVFDADDSLTLVGERETAGKGKHIAVGQDGNVYFSYFTQRNSDVDAALPLHIESVGNDNNTGSISFAAGTVAPNNGKNVIAEYGDLIYSCQGTNGLQVYNKSGEKVGEYVLNDTTSAGKDLKICANGVYVDANYVYVAYGSRGLRVLNRSNLSEVARFVSGRSANYVTVDDQGYIYVAYGRNNIKVFKLVDAQ